MIDPVSAPSNPIAPAAPVPPPSRGQFLLAWLAILAIGGTIVFWQNFVRSSGDAGGPKQAAQLTALELMLRYQLGMPEFLQKFSGQAEDKEKADEQQREAMTKLLESIESLNKGSVAQRLRVIIVLGELDGPNRAIAELDKLEAQAKKFGHKFTPDEQRQLEVLNRLYKDCIDGRPNVPTVTPQEREELVRDFDFFGELALAPRNPDDADNVKRREILGAAQQTMMIVVGVFFAALVALAMGVIGLLILGILALNGTAKSRLGGAVPHQAIYVETFAIWLGVFFGVVTISPKIGVLESLPEVARMALPFIVSLGVLAWPIFRGVPWKQVRHDIGLTLGSQPLLEPMLGIVSYLNSLPFLVVGIAVYFGLMRLTASAAAPVGDPFASEPTIAHPLINNLRNATAADILPYFLLMCVCAPVTEEIMFRGCLYRHLRDATRGQVLGAVFSMVAAGFVFAAIHPQGVLAIPILASLACGFALAREWRGTLIPSIIAHGINNCAVLVMIIAMFAKW
jgi:membrane protease YdiL (CAAX protease family)